MVKIQSLLTSLLVVGAICLSALEVSAKPDNKAPKQPAGNPSNQPANCTAGSVTAGLLTYTSCIGSFTGNDVTDGAAGGGDDPLLDQLTAGVFDGLTNWSLLEKVDQPGNGSVLSWTETSEGIGKWSVSTPITSPFVLSLKAGNSWSAYYFANPSNLSISEGLWNTLGVSLAGNGNNGKGLSHASIFVAPGGDDPVEVPEPTVLAGLGLIAASSLNRLRKKPA